MDIRVCPTEIEPRSVAELYGSVGWGDPQAYRDAELRMMVAQSTFFAVAEENGQMIGLLRALSDRVSVTWIAEVVVQPAYQRRGVGAALIAVLLREFAHTAIYAEALAGTDPFFARFGITAKPGKLIACSRKPYPDVQPR